jgi:hypothetical protein
MDRPAGVRMPRLCRTCATAASVEPPERWIWSMAARVVALALWRFAERAVLAASIVWAAIGLPRFRLASMTWIPRDGAMIHSVTHGRRMELLRPHNWLTDAIYSNGMQ